MFGMEVQGSFGVWDIPKMMAQGKKQKGLHFCKPLFCLVRPKGFEPLTPWFVAKYSIQLSYGRI